MKEDELSNQLKSQNLDTVEPSSLLKVGGPVFPDVPTVGGLASFRHVVDSYRAVHTPSYGTAIPKTGLVTSKDGQELLLTPTVNEIHHLLGVSFTNSGGSAPIVVNILLGGSEGFPIQLDSQQSLSNFAVPPGSSVASFPLDLYVGKNLPVFVKVISGTAAELNTKLLSIQTSQ